MGKSLLGRVRIQTVLLYHLTVGAVGLIAVKLSVSPATWPDLRGVLIVGGYTGIITTLAPIGLYTAG